MKIAKIIIMIFLINSCTSLIGKKDCFVKNNIPSICTIGEKGNGIYLGQTKEEIRLKFNNKVAENEGIYDTINQELYANELYVNKEDKDTMEVYYKFDFYKNSLTNCLIEVKSKSNRFSLVRKSINKHLN